MRSDDAIRVGSRVEAGDGEEYDTGEVISLNESDLDYTLPNVELALVAWDSGVTNTCAVDDLRLTSRRFSGGYEVQS